MQLGLDWQHRCASIERDHYRKSEELIQGLTVAREQVCAQGPTMAVAGVLWKEDLGMHWEPRRPLGLSP